ncbi:MAG: LLM class flavin-dependent oxidoreductase [Mycobacteriaceae bacterium]
MALRDRIAFGMSLPHRSAEPISATVVRQVAVRAEVLGFQDLWVTNNILDEAHCLDSVTVLTFAAAVTTTIRLGISVLVLPIHHPIHVAQQIATLDHLSGGRAILGVGIGRADDYAAFQVPTARRVRRFVESVAMIKALWDGPRVTYRGEIFRTHDVTLGTGPTQRPHPPIWMGGAHPDAIRRAATLSDGWMAGGGTSNASFERAVPLLRESLQRAGRDPATFPISKRIFISVHADPAFARAELDAWFNVVYRDPSATEQAGIFGTPQQVREQLEKLAAIGANHLLLNPVTRYLEQAETLAEIVGQP